MHASKMPISFPISQVIQHITSCVLRLFSTRQTRCQMQYNNVCALPLSWQRCRRRSFRLHTWAPTTSLRLKSIEKCHQLVTVLYLVIMTLGFTESAAPATSSGQNTYLQALTGNIRPSLKIIERLHMLPYGFVDIHVLYAGEIRSFKSPKSSETLVLLR